MNKGILVVQVNIEEPEWISLKRVDKRSIRMRSGTSGEEKRRERDNRWSRGIRNANEEEG